MNMKCTNCDQSESFNICADIWGKYDVKGLDTKAQNLPESGPVWDQYAGCQCPKCGHTGIVEDFLDGEAE